MKFATNILVVLVAFGASNAQYVPDGTEIVTDPVNGLNGYCYDFGFLFDYAWKNAVRTVDECNQLCLDNAGAPGALLGFDFFTNQPSGYNDETCYCQYENHMMPSPCPSDFDGCEDGNSGTGPIEDVFENTGAAEWVCYRYVSRTESNGDPHFRTWKNEHFEFHGQCDVVMTHVKDFSDGMDLDIHLRTSMVRYWSYIKSAAIRIGHDVLEVEGLQDFSASYWINYEHNGELDTLGGFPVSINNNNDKYTIDLATKFPGQKIEIKTFKEFVGVKIIGANAASFGNAQGITGNFKTGKTVARDGSTEIHDFNELGLEWQVLPSDGKLFHQMARPQFPEMCYLPEDPRGERTRRLLGESEVTEEAAEAACAKLEDEFDRKGCVYDILATQDLDMVGAY